MARSNLDIIDDFFIAYGGHDQRGLQRVLAEDVKWIFPGQNPLSGTYSGIWEVVEFFDTMGSIMRKSNTKVDPLVMGSSTDHVVQCQHIRTNRDDGRDLDHYWCVLWTLEKGKIVEGRHLSSEQREADEFFNGVLQSS